MNWRPLAEPAVWHARAALLDTIRSFFKNRSVLEVTTPVLAASTVTDPHIHSFRVMDSGAGANPCLYLQTSPEYAMKRLLAAGSGPIYQICPAFRDEEHGRHHNCEFTLLEWYRPGFDLDQLLDEMDALLAECLGLTAGRRLRYQQVFEHFLQLDPFTAGPGVLSDKASRLGLAASRNLDTDGLLDFLFTQAIQPRLGPGLHYVMDYPPAQAALSRIRDGQPPVARRVEVFVDGLELANGYEELLDAHEQRLRFERDLARRSSAGLALPAMDELLLSALHQGLPECAGIALGLERLLMLALGASSIDQVLCFSPYRD